MRKGSLLFFGGCIPARFFLAYTVARALETRNDKLVDLLKVVLVSISMGFAIIYIFGLRKTGPEVFEGNGLIWWNNMRPFHSFMYGLAAYLLSRGSVTAGGVIAMDALFGVMAHLVHTGAG